MYRPIPLCQLDRPLSLLLPTHTPTHSLCVLFRASSLIDSLTPGIGGEVPPLATLANNFKAYYLLIPYRYRLTHT